jgi:carbon storage regulator CsrA
MLVLTRKVGEQICIPQFGIAFRVLGVHGARVRLGIVAPQEIAIVREELVGRDARCIGQAAATDGRPQPAPVSTGAAP